MRLSQNDGAFVEAKKVVLALGNPASGPFNLETAVSR